MNWTYFIIMAYACFLYYVKSADFNCTEGEDCIVSCNGTNACREANITCPSDARCDIKCIGYAACQAAILNWNNPIAGTGSLTCDGDHACYGVQFPTPLPDEALNVTCDTDDECAKATIVCPTNARCDIKCISDYACSRANINCPSDARCDIQCIGGDACYDATFNWNNPIAGTGSLTCDGRWTCDGVQFPTPLPDEALNITCDNYNECAWATIVCPTNAECRVICSGDEACREATIESCGELVVTCAPNACTNKEEICTTSPPTSQPTSQPTTATSAPTTSTGQPTSQPTTVTGSPTSAPTSSTSAPTSSTSAPTTATSPPTQPTSAPTTDNSSDAFVYFCSCIFFLVMLFV